ncbi:MAG: NUDIX domain-containing protein [Patescibacteria group bacterium]
MNHLDTLQSLDWVEGSHIPLPKSSYRHRIVIACLPSGRQKANFANGKFPYFAYTELLNEKGQRISHGNNIVPVLSDGRFLMIVEQRPILERYPDHQYRAAIGGQTIDLGLCGSLEFPGGAVETKEDFTASFLRELVEETGIDEQEGILYRRIPPVYSFGSDLALAMFYNVIYLSGFSFPDHVNNDGGLNVYALSRREVEHNIITGAISSGQAALFGWSFYKEVERIHRDTVILNFLDTSTEFISCRNVVIKKPA